MPKAKMNDRGFKKREPMTQADKDFNKKNDPIVQQGWIDALKDTLLTTWEMDFIESIEEQLQAGRRLSIKQIEVLERIYSEKA